MRQRTSCRGARFKSVYVWTALWNIDTKIDHRSRVVPRGGYVVHASSNAACTSVYHNDDGAIKEVKTTSGDTRIGNLHYATLTFDVAETIEDMIELTKQRASWPRQNIK